ncbi:FkbM family methyltransferase [Actinomycetospora flava]|uniref:FkbM family methyltransferase n=1 Tax=Actinomycetospora flava TaxID=3129232 RepID=A0ABU8M6C7_9PSEU
MKYAVQRAYLKVRRRPFEDDFRGVPELRLTQDALILDVGANRGQSVDALALTAPGRRVVSFEPNPLLAARLRGRYGKHAHWTLVEAAVGRQEGTFTLFIPAYRGYVFDGLASLNRDEAETWLASRICRFDPRLLSIEEFEVQTVSLDDLALAPALIKIDVQGLELDVLQGGVGTLEAYSPVLLIETPIAEVGAFLKDLDYAPMHWSGDRLVAGSGDTLNTFFVRSG